MPTYEYQCTQCGYKFDKFQNITETAVSECPMCGGFVERLISGGAGVLFKGSGFYVNDYKKDTCCSRGQSCDNPKRCCEK